MSERKNSLPCYCTHFEYQHKFRDKPPLDVLYEFTKTSNKLIVIHDPNSTRPKGFQLKSGRFFTVEQALEEMEKVRTLDSKCLSVKCKCQAFNADNLAYLEKRYESKQNPLR